MDAKELAGFKLGEDEERRKLLEQQAFAKLQPDTMEPMPQAEADASAMAGSQMMPGSGFMPAGPGLLDNRAMPNRDVYRDPAQAQQVIDGLGGGDATSIPQGFSGDPRMADNGQTTVAGNIARDVGGDISDAGKWLKDKWSDTGQAMERMWRAPGNALIKAAGVGNLPSETPISNGASVSPTSATGPQASSANTPAETAMSAAPANRAAGSVGSTGVAPKPNTPQGYQKFMEMASLLSHAPTEQERQMLRKQMGDWLDAHETASTHGAESASQQEGMLYGRAGEMLAEREQMAAQHQQQSRLEQNQIDNFERISKEARSMKVDPNRFVNSMDFGQKLSAVAAITFGAISTQGQAGGPNPGMQALQKLTEADINAQREAIDQANGRAADVKGTYAMLREKGLSDNAAAAGQRVITHEMFLNRLNAQSAGTASQKIKDDYGILKESILQQNAKDEVALGAGIRANAEQMYLQSLRPTGAAAPKKPDELFVTTGPGGIGYRAKSPKEADQARGLQYAKDNVVPILNRLKKLREESYAAARLGNKAGWETANTARMKSLTAQGILEIRELNKTSPGAMDKGLQELAGDIMGGWTDVQGHPEAKADEFMQSIDAKLDSLQRSQGGQTAVEVTVPTARGDFTTDTVGLPATSSPRPAMPKGTAVK